MASADRKTKTADKITVCFPTYTYSYMTNLPDPVRLSHTFCETVANEARN